MEWFLLFISLIGSYLLGSVNAAVLLSKAIGHKDVRDYGSGNAGMTNMMRVMGFLPGVLTFLIDVLKGTLTCYLAKFVVFPFIFEQLPYEIFRPEYAVYYCGMLCLLGHMYPVFFGFKGGKGVSTTLGIGFICCWQTALVCFGIFLIVLAISRIVSLSSVVIAVAIPFVTVLFAEEIPGAPYSRTIQILLISVLSVNLLITHRTNIARLIKGEEKKLVIKKSKESEK